MYFDYLKIKINVILFIFLFFINFKYYNINEYIGYIYLPIYKSNTYNNIDYYIINNNNLLIELSNLNGTFKNVFVKYNNEFVNFISNYNMMYKYFLNNINMNNVKFNLYKYYVNNNYLHFIFVSNYINNFKIYYYYYFPYYNRYSVYFLPIIKKYNKNNNINYIPINKFYVKHNLSHIENNINMEKKNTNMYISYYIDNNYMKNKNIFKNVSWISSNQQFFSLFIELFKLNNIVKCYVNNYNILDAIKSHLLYVKYNTINNNLNSYKIKLSFLPMDYNIINKYNNEFIDVLPLGYKLIRYINEFILIKIINIIYNYISNIGIVAIIFTLIIKIFFFPAIYYQYIYLLLIKYVKKKIINNNNKNSTYINNLKNNKLVYYVIKLNKYNIILSYIFAFIQILIFFSIFKLFSNYIIFRKKKFLWINDLSDIDNSINLPMYIPFFGNHISILSILYSIIFYYHSKINNKILMIQNINIYNNSKKINTNIILFISTVFIFIIMNNYISIVSVYCITSILINSIVLSIIYRILKNILL